MNTDLKSDSASVAAEAKAIRKHRIPARKQGPTLQAIVNGGKQLHGDFSETGASIGMHDFEIEQRVEWSRSFQADSLEICLNVGGHGVIECGERVLKFAPLTAGFYFPEEQTLRAWRQANERHRFISVQFSGQFLRKRLGCCDGALHSTVEAFLAGSPLETRFGELHRLTAGQEQLAMQLMNPPVPQGARALWYEGKLLEIMAGFLFERKGKDELFCDRQKRLARERVERVMVILQQNLVEPLSLQEIGRRVGCSPFHLSRIFSSETGTTIPLYLRRLRMERAAALLRCGDFNVTEVALEVGYSSLSHFSHAFCQTMGCCPGLYPLKKS